jgi:conjugal transfer pilus assembly protein TraE
MFFNKSITDRGQAISLANKLMTVLIIMFAFLLFTSYAAITKKSTLVIVPPKLDKRIELAYNSADADYHIRFALYASYLFGNVTPETIKTTVKAMEYLFTPELFHQVNQELIAQAEELANSGNTISFLAKNFQYEPETNLVFITGQQTIRSASGTTRETLLTYEFKIEVNSHVPTIYHLAAYEGVAHNKFWRDEHSSKLSTGS